jgi:hydrogenase nickel incorporation protein HypA/HybF
MHEASLMRALMKRIGQVAAESGAERVTAVSVRLGALSHMSPEHFREHWDVESRDSIAQDAALTIEASGDLSDPAAQDVTLLSIDVAE